MIDLTSLFNGQASGPAQPMQYRQGRIIKWNAVTLENQVVVGQTTYENLPVLGVAEAASLSVGSIVGLALVGSTAAIIGRFVLPGTAEAIDAITQLGRRTYTASVASAQSTTSGTFADLATLGPMVEGVQIPASGKALVTISATIAPGVNAFFGAVGVEASGPTIVAPNLTETLNLEGSVSIGGSRAVTLTGLTPGGIYTFSLKYIADGFEVFFSGRTITVVTV